MKHTTSQSTMGVCRHLTGFFVRRSMSKKYGRSPFPVSVSRCGVCDFAQAFDVSPIRVGLVAPTTSISAKTTDNFEQMITCACVRFFAHIITCACVHARACLANWLHCAGVTPDARDPRLTTVFTPCGPPSTPLPVSPFPTHTPTKWW